MWFLGVQAIKQDQMKTDEPPAAEAHFEETQAEMADDSQRFKLEPADSQAALSDSDPVPESTAANEQRIERGLLCVCVDGWEGRSLFSKKQCRVRFPVSVETFFFSGWLNLFFHLREL